MNDTSVLSAGKAFSPGLSWIGGRLHRYLLWEITRPLLGVLAVLMGIFAGYLATSELISQHAALLTPAALGRVVGIKLLLAMDVLLPMALYLSMIIGLGRLQSDQELVVMKAMGWGGPHVLQAMLPLILLVAGMAAYLSLLVRPWGYSMLYEQRQAATENMNLASLEPGHFQLLGRSVLFAEDHAGNQLLGVYFDQQTGSTRMVIRARAVEEGHDESGARSLLFHAGWLYLLAAPPQADTTIHFQTLVVHIPLPSQPATASKPKMLPSLALWRSPSLPHTAELQWRLWSPVSAVMLGILAIPLSRGPPRGGRFGKVLVALAAAALYYNSGAALKGFMQAGELPPIPGLFLVPLLVVTVMLVGVFLNRKRP
jgi:lipopolysaccharide export system permease protein